VSVFLTSLRKEVSYIIIFSKLLLGAKNMDVEKTGLECIYFQIYAVIHCNGLPVHAVRHDA
jgi:hypothetical protein